MDEILNISNIELGNVSITNFLIGFVFSIINGLFLKYIYSNFSIAVTNKKLISLLFPLFGVAIYVIVVTIKSSIVLSLGLVGALSIIRFRTAIKEPEQIIYFLILTGSSIALAANSYIFSFMLVIAVYVYAQIIYKRNVKDIIYQNEILYFTYENFNDSDLSKLEGIIAKLGKDILLQSMTRNQNTTTIILKCSNIDKSFLRELNNFYENENKITEFQLYNSVE